MQQKRRFEATRQRAPQMRSDMRSPAAPPGPIRSEQFHASNASLLAAADKRLSVIDKQRLHRAARPSIGCCPQEDRFRRQTVR
jgi:hypothetical protein